ncbi:hypothetical protein, partial [Staphylococcus aureus]
IKNIEAKTYVTENTLNEYNYRKNHMIKAMRRTLKISIKSTRKENQYVEQLLMGYSLVIMFS